MNKKGEICIGVAGAGRATELHMNALKRNSGIPVCYKHIIARHMAVYIYRSHRFPDHLINHQSLSWHL